MIFKAIFSGLALGLALALSLGPSFFALIQTSTKRGFRPALGLAFGIFLSDLFCVVLAYLGVAQFFDDPQNKIYVGLVGGTVLVMFGFFSAFQKKEVVKKDMVVKEASIPLYITKGFFLNLLNPVVIGLWMACVVSVSSNKAYTTLHIFLFFISSLTTVFLTDALKAYSANKISAFLSEKVLRMVGIIAGIILMISGLIMIYKVFV
ncbi:MAG TPA: LysE family transporter [Bacteroidia bacterium]|jgi:threonine/homoserine/homoserine lactone efflux protein